ncbi:hypothetical protein CIPAW_13G133900 [Carya illinoinensis]|uniref:Uncharacterized protein n=1 Tax=Carya illinoinensis TaxID=32201 RepID=A0A8T1NQ19_CARIL|nr:hypothetical protein CIPAW_13G133900 [Carya illinoinensis]
MGLNSNVLRYKISNKCLFLMEMGVTEIPQVSLQIYTNMIIHWLTSSKNLIIPNIEIKIFRTSQKKPLISYESNERREKSELFTNEQASREKKYKERYLTSLEKENMDGTL